MTLSRMARSEMADHVKMFELFTSLEEFTSQTGNQQFAEVLEETIHLYSTMQEDLAYRDTTIVHNVLDMQTHCAAWLLNLKDKLKGLHSSVENHVAGYEDQIMEIQVFDLSAFLLALPMQDVYTYILVRLILFVHSHTQTRKHAVCCSTCLPILVE